MFYVSRVSNKGCYVDITDTSDNTVERWLRRDVLALMQSTGVKVRGVNSNGDCYDATEEVIKSQLQKYKFVGMPIEDYTDLCIKSYNGKKVYSMGFCNSSDHRCSSKYRGRVLRIPYGVAIFESVAGGAISGGNDYIKKLVLPDTMRRLGGLFDFTALSEVDLGHGLEVLGAGCFYNCKSLKKLCLPKSMISVKEECFLGSGIEELILWSGDILATNTIEVKRILFKCIDLRVMFQMYYAGEVYNISGEIGFEANSILDIFVQGNEIRISSTGKLILIYHGKKYKLLKRRVKLLKGDL